MKTIGKNLFFSENEWAKRYFARQSALLIYEAINDVFKLIDNDFRRVILKFSSSEKLNLELKEFTTKLNNYKVLILTNSKRLDIIV